jgi:hypothetical protein
MEKSPDPVTDSLLPGELDATRQVTYLAEFLDYANQIAAYKRKVYRAKIADPAKLMDAMGGEENIEKHLPGNARINKEALKEPAKSPTDIYLENYTKVFNTGKNQLAHIEYIKEQLFLPNKLAILLDANTTQASPPQGVHRNVTSEIAKYDWLNADKGLVLRYNPDDRKNKALNSQAKIYLTSLYRDSVIFRREKLDELNKMGTPSSVKDGEVTYPIGLVYCLYRIFVFCTNDPTERETLGNHVIYLRKQLGLTSADKPQAKTSAVSRAISRYTKGKINLGDIPGGDNELVTGFLQAVEGKPQIEELLTEVLSELNPENGGLEMLGDIMLKATDKSLHNRIAKVAADLDPANLPDAVKNVLPAGMMPNASVVNSQSIDDTILSASKFASEKLGEGAPNSAATSVITNMIKSTMEGKMAFNKQESERRAIIIIPRKNIIESVKLCSTPLVFT